MISIPVLDIALAVVRAFKVQRLTAQKGYGFGLDFAQVLRRSFGVGKVCFAGVT